MSKLKNKQYTFWELLNQCGIKIPIIQRDYAQGRDVDKIKNIRDIFLTNLFDVLKNSSKPIDLDFVYGTEKDGYLIPLDGQQRLTTLFLLHYYLALQDGKLNSNTKDILKRFTYETRLSSNEFCNLIVIKPLTLYSSLTTKKPVKISNIIKEQSWFFSIWENDPTIKAMLIMLDSIQEKFIGEENLFEKLISIENKPITFSFLNLDEFKLTDELYIKMNARGKPLSNFENFKSKFEESIEKYDFIGKKKIKIKSKIDNEWFDIFWGLESGNLKKNKDSEESRKQILKKIDNLYLNFFINTTAWLCFEDIEKFNDVDIFKFEYNEESIENIEKILNSLYINKEIFLKEDTYLEIFIDFISLDSSQVEYEKRLKFYVIYRYILQTNKIDESQLKQWVRVNFNIIHNTIYNKYDDYADNIKLINKLSKMLRNNSFYQELANSEIFSESDFYEEKVKANLIQNEDWTNSIIEAEEHEYLNGQINFLLKLSKDDNKKYEVSKFKAYKNKFETLWKFLDKKDKDDSKKKETLIHRALLTTNVSNNDKKGYIQDTKHGQKRYTFCTFGTGLREKNENWRKVFDSAFFKQFLDDLSLDIDIETQLNQKIDSYKVDNWKKYFIKSDTIIKYARNYQIEWLSDDNIFLNRGYWDGKSAVGSWGWKNGFHYYLYYLKENIKKIEPFETIKTNDEIIYLHNWAFNEDSFDIDFKLKDEKFYIEFTNTDEDKFLDNLPNEIVTILKDNDFQFLDRKYINSSYNHDNKNDLINFIEDLCKSLMKLAL